MKAWLALGAVALSLAIHVGAAPTDDAEFQVPSDADVSPPEVGYRKETLDTVKRDSSVENKESKTKSKEKVKVKHLKNGGTMTVITDSSRTKTKSDLLTDEFSQTNHTLEAGGLADSTSLTQDHQHELKEVDTVKKKDREVIIRDKYGNVISDSKKEKVKEKTKKKEKDKERKSLVHTVRRVDPDPAPDAGDDAPAPDC